LLVFCPERRSLVAMKTLSLDLRERIVKAYDSGNDTRDSVAARFGVSVGMVMSRAG
jgi:transposase